ncbi:MAG: alpha-2-macroglobulin [Planctomycetes bacterium]|nr:alpha-2-macroglobulin [Planctomycetota bacterium]
MFTKAKTSILGGIVVLAAAGVYLLAGEGSTIEQRREELKKTFNAGNFKDAYEGLRKLALDPRNTQAGLELDLAVNALHRLGRIDEVDEFREKVIAVHKDDWRVLQTAARSYASVEHYGFIVAGKFNRGGRRGGGNLARFVNTMERDRARALQLMQQALPLADKDQNKQEVGQFYMYFGQLLMSGAGHYDAWRLQYLTELSKLPDYDEVNNYRYRYGGQAAPVDDKGNPIYHHRPESYDKAQTDGQRWRWMLAQAQRTDPNLANQADAIFGDFLKSQFGVQTMAYYGWRFGGQPDNQEQGKTGTFALHTLKDTETIARLANGIKRFTLPDEFNYIKVFERIADRGKDSYGESALTKLSQEYEDRRQYPTAADLWRRTIIAYGPGNNNWRTQRLEQIVGNWGRFEPHQAQAAGTKAVVDFRFRNADKVSFEAHAIKVGKLLNDVKAYLDANPGRVDWNEVNIGNIGYRLVELNQQHYLGKKVAGWDMKLKPRPKHVDDRVTIETPLTKPGAYLLKGKLANGNESRIIVWVNDTIILKKQLDGKAYYNVADAVTGQPVAGAGMEFFGWQVIPVAPNVNQYKVVTRRHNVKTDADGQAFTAEQEQPSNYQWLITAKKNDQDGERFAYLGFTNVWYNRIHDPEYNATRIFALTDRPVYRPEQLVHFKAWVRHAKYDQADTSSFAQEAFHVVIHNPKGEKVLEKDYTTDEYGGLAGEFFLPKGATLGNYNVSIHRPNKAPHVGGGISFRVEEYKKPEFEVKVEAPKEPVRLGEVINATIDARYYFGAPVTKAKVKYKVLRTSHSAEWYPAGRWDWMFGRGYWWFSPDFAWYPGWLDWGCRRPMPWWWGQRHEQPEVVLENEVEIGPDGTVKVPIDTKPAQELHGNQDHAYSITAEVVDESRRTIVGTGKVLVSRKPFQVYSWLNRGHYRVGDTVDASFRAQTLDQKPVTGKGELTLYRISYNDKNEPVEKAEQTWKLDTNVEGTAEQQFKAARAGQYRLSYRLTDSKKNTIEGGYLFLIRGEGFAGKDFRFNDIEMTVDKREYKPGEKIKLLINTDRTDGTVLLFVRPTNGVYLPPKIVRLQGKSTVQEIDVTKKDMPNFFIEAVTVSNGKIHTDNREVVVPPEKRILNIAVVPTQQEYKPGQKAAVKIRLTELDGTPFVGSTVVSMYDKAVEYISGGSNVPDIKEFYWKWRRSHHPSTESSLQHFMGNLMRRGEVGMSNLGVFGDTVVEELKLAKGFGGRGGAHRDEMERGALANKQAGAPAAPGGAPTAEADGMPADRMLGEGQQKAKYDAKGTGPGNAGQPAGMQPAVRKNFADSAFWNGALTTNDKGEAEFSLTMPENLTAWKIRVWAMGHGTKVGQTDVEVTTKKDLLVRLQAPRFFVQKDEVVLSANVHNYLQAEKKVDVKLDLAGGTLVSMEPLARQVTIAAGGEKRIDWRVKVVNEGDAIVRMTATCDVDGDAMEMRFPCLVHGMEKFESFTGVIRPDKDSGLVAFTVPAERRVNQTRLEVRYSPSLAAAMVDALPYLVDYPYGCTEQTLNRFLPTVITQRTLQRMKIDLKEVEKHQVNLNSQEIGKDKDRLEGWKRYERNPVFNEADVKTMSEAGINRLASMQCSDGGWGWFSGFGERSYPHTTALVVHGLQLAKLNGMQLPQGMLERGVAWLQSHQDQQVRMILNAPTKTFPWKEKADNTDAMVHMVLADASVKNQQMQDFLYRDRNDLAVYAKAMFGLALFKEQQGERLAMIMKNISQFVVEDEENQTAYLRLPQNNYWWYWYGSETEANAYYLKLLSLTNPQDKKASRLVKYLLNNRKHATYWNSTRDTAVCVEAFADYIKASGEDRPDMIVEVWLDGKKMKEAKIDSSNLFTFDNKLILEGDAVDTGKHRLEIKRRGTGPVYYNAYLTNFTLEDFITKAGLEVRVNRKYYKLTSVDHRIKVPGAKGQPLGQKVEKFVRSELKNMDELKSGDLVEIELEIDSKNDYEYLIFEDPKAAGFEPFDVRSGYIASAAGAYMELRDEKVCFFVRQLPRGKHSVSYKMRAEIPGRFSALPTRAYAMYAPELRGNSDEIKLRIRD